MKRNIPEERTLQERASSPSWATLSTDAREFRANIPRVMFPEEDALTKLENYHELRWSGLQGPSTLVLRGFFIDSVKEHFPFRKINAQNLERMAQSWLEIMTAANPPKHQLQTLYNCSTLTISIMKRLLCALLVCERQSSHLWTDGPMPPKSEADIDTLLNTVTSGSFNSASADSESVFKKFDSDSEEWSDTYRSAIVTHHGHLGITFRFVRPGDKICALYGGRSLFVLRKNSLFINMTTEDRNAQRGGPCYEMICGDCLIYGLEDGQGVNVAKAMSLIEEDIRLV